MTKSKFKNKTILNAICIDRGITHAHIEKTTQMKCLKASNKSTSCLKTFKMLKEIVSHGILDKNTMLRVLESYILNTDFDAEIAFVQENNRKNSRINSSEKNKNNA